jgi:hypothetical protein
MTSVGEHCEMSGNTYDYTPIIRRNLTALKMILVESSDIKKEFKIKCYENVLENIPMSKVIYSRDDLVHTVTRKELAGSSIMNKIYRVMSTRTNLEEVDEYYKEHCNSDADYDPIYDESDDTDDDEDDYTNADEGDDDDTNADEGDDGGHFVQGTLHQHSVFIQIINDIENYVYYLDVTQPEVNNMFKELANLKKKYTPTFY